MTDIGGLASAAVAGRYRSAPAIRTTLTSRGAYVLAVAFLVESYLAKSFIFVGNDPTVLHYALSALLAGAMFIGFCARKEAYVGRTYVFFLSIVLLLWLAFGAFMSEIELNYVATFTFSILLMSCYFWFPYVATRAGVETTQLLLGVFLVPTLASVPMLVAAPSLAFDLDSGRFSGAYISVAVACNMFFYVSVLGAFAWRNARTTKSKRFYLVVTGVALLLLYLTRTRSSLSEAMICLYIIAITNPNGRIISSRLILSSIAISVSAVLTILVFFAVGGNVATQVQDFRLEQGITASRNLNWEFGIERIKERPVFGEGLLAKQTQGGQSQIDLSRNDNYNMLYDPHSLVLSLAVQGGIPFAVGMMILIIGTLLAYMHLAGWLALATPEFVLCAVNLLFMIPAGGDLTSLGTENNRIYWILLGSLSLKGIALHRQARAGVRRVPRPTTARDARMAGSIS